MGQLEDFLSGVSPQEKKGIEFAIDYIKDREQLDRLSNLSRDDMILLIKLYTIYQMFLVKNKPVEKVESILDKYLALSCSKNGFGMVKIVDMFKTDMEFTNQLPKEI